MTNGTEVWKGTLQLLYALVAAGLIGLSGWTLYTVKELAVAVARVQEGEDWIKQILTEQSRKLDATK